MFLLSAAALSERFAAAAVKLPARGNLHEVPQMTEILHRFFNRKLRVALTLRL